MAAVGAFPAGKGVARGFRQDAGVILFAVRRGFVGHGGVHMLLRIVPAQDGGYGGLGQAVVDALDRRQGDAEGGTVRPEQPASGKGLHAGEPDVLLFADFVHLDADRVDAVQPLGVGFGKVVFQVVRRRHQVKGGVDAEEDHLHQAAFRRFFRDHGVVGGKADVPDLSLGFELQHVVQIGAGLGQVVFPVAFQVHIVDHPQVDIVRLEPFQQVLKGDPALLYVPGAGVLAVLVGGAHVALHIPARPVVRDGFADDVPRFGVGHPAVDDVDAQAVGVTHQGDGFALFVPLQPLAAKAHLADHQICFSKLSVLHGIASLLK